MSQTFVGLGTTVSDSKQVEKSPCFGVSFGNISPHPFGLVDPSSNRSTPWPVAQIDPHDKRLVWQICTLLEAVLVASLAATIQSDHGFLLNVAMSLTRGITGATRAIAISTSLNPTPVAASDSIRLVYSPGTAIDGLMPDLWADQHFAA